MHPWQGLDQKHLRSTGDPCNRINRGIHCLFKRNWVRSEGMSGTPAKSLPDALAATATPPSAPAPSVGLSNLPPTIPDHTVICRIGGGSPGEVRLARSVLGELRAVKVISRSRFSDDRPFEREFEGIQRFEPISRSHPSQLAILHVGKNDDAGCFYYVMELADDAKVGQASSLSGVDKNSDAKTGKMPVPLYSPHTLRHDIEQHGRLPITACVQIGLSLTTALAHLHQHGLVHRDINPSNVIFVNGVPKLGEIGLVTEAGDTQSIVGTEGYIPPEGPGTQQADIFSLGKVLYEISTGMDRRRFAELPEDLRSWPDCREVVEFNGIVLKACAKEPVRRYQSAEAMRKDLAVLESGRSVKRQHAWQLSLSYAKNVTVAGDSPVKAPAAKN